MGGEASPYPYTDDATAVLRASDFLVNTLPSTPATRGLLSGDALQACACDARAPGRPTIFINVGRGDIMDEASILNALESGWIDHAVLDVFPIEPLPKCGPFARTPQRFTTIVFALPPRAWAVHPQGVSPLDAPKGSHHAARLCGLLPDRCRGHLCLQLGEVSGGGW